MKRAMTLRTLCRNQRGATIVEFAMILPVLSVLLMGTFDLAYRSYVTSIIQGALHEAARMATVGNVPTDTIEAHVQGRLRDFSRDAVIETNTDSYSDFTGVGVSEPLTSDVAPLGVYNEATDCYRDINNSGKFSADMGRSGMGGSEDVVRFEVVMTYPRLLPMGGLLGWSDDVEVRQNTVLRNQPWAARAVSEAPILCRTPAD